MTKHTITDLDGRIYNNTLVACDACINFHTYIATPVWISIRIDYWYCTAKWYNEHCYIYILGKKWYNKHSMVDVHFALLKPRQQGHISTNANMYPNLPLLCEEHYEHITRIYSYFWKCKFHMMLHHIQISPLPAVEVILHFINCVLDFFWFF